VSGELQAIMLESRYGQPSSRQKRDMMIGDYHGR